MHFAKGERELVWLKSHSQVTEASLSSVPRPQPGAQPCLLFPAREVQLSACPGAVLSINRGTQQATCWKTLAISLLESGVPACIAYKVLEVLNEPGIVGWELQILDNSTMNVLCG